MMIMMMMMIRNLDIRNIEAGVEVEADIEVVDIVAEVEAEVEADTVHIIILNVEDINYKKN